ELFALEYVANGLNATQAYLRVSPGVTYGTARAKGSELLAKGNVRGRVDQLKAEWASRREVDWGNLHDRLVAMATTQARDVIEWDHWNVKPRPSAELAPHAASAIAEVSKTKDGVTVKLHDPMRAMRLLAELRGELKRVVENTGEVRWVMMLPDK